MTAYCYPCRHQDKRRGCMTLPTRRAGNFRFPKAVHDDMVDAFSMGIIYTEHLLSTGWQAREGLVQSE